MSFMTEWLLFGICMLCNRPFTQVNRKKAVSRNGASPCILCKIVHTPLQRNARKICWPKCLHPHYQRSPIGLFSPIIFTQISAQSRNLDPNFRLIPSSQPKFPLNSVILMVFSASHIPCILSFQNLALFCFKIPNNRLQIRQIQYPEKPTGDPHFQLPASDRAIFVWP